MRLKWQVKDLIDLEYFLGQAAEYLTKTDTPQELSPDRKFYLKYEKSGPRPFSRRELIRHWLEAKRTAAAGDLAGTGRLPGAAYAETIALLRGLIIIMAFAGGALLAWSVLSYGGKSPINIFSCIWILIVPQLFLLLLLGISLLLSRMNANDSVKGGYTLIASMIRYFAGRLKSSGYESLSANQRMRLNAVSGLIGRHKTIYGAVFFWPVFILGQTAGVCFNIGLITAALLKLTITDLAFGWQSTLLSSPDRVYRIVDIFSAPWSWAPYARPGIEHIEGSQIILKEGMAHLMTPDLVSWWPFLCYSIIFYGLMPRLIILAESIRRQRVALSQITFSHSACDRLIQHMRAPKIQSKGRNYSPAIEKVVAEISPDDVFVPAQPDGDDALTDAIILVPEDLDLQFAHEDLRERIRQVLGLKVLNRICIQMDPDKDMAKIADAMPKNEPAMREIRLVVLMEAWQPPIRETLSWLKHLRSTTEKSTGIIIALTGKPAGRMVFTSPDNTDRVIWEQTVNGLGDPFIRVENMGGG